MRKLLFLYAVCLLLVFPVVANATTIAANLTGTRSTAYGGGLTAADGWSGDDNNGFEISWDISYDGTSLYTYEYTVSGVGDYLSFGLSYLNMEVTKPSSQNDFVMERAEAVNRETKVNKDDTYKDLSKSSKILFEGPAKFELGGDMLDNIYAIKWDMGIFGKNNDDIVEFVISFTTDKDPVWGNFYANANDSIVAEAWNLGFGETPTSDFMRWIARPDGAPTINHAPEPATMLLLGSGLIGIAVSGKKRLKKRNGMRP